MLPSMVQLHLLRTSWSPFCKTWFFPAKSVVDPGLSRFRPIGLIDTVDDYMISDQN